MTKKGWYRYIAENRPTLAAITTFAIGTTATAMSTTTMLTILIGWRSDLVKHANKVGNEHRKNKRSDIS